MRRKTEELIPWARDAMEPKDIRHRKNGVRLLQLTWIKAMDARFCKHSPRYGNFLATPVIWIMAGTMTMKNAFRFFLAALCLLVPFVSTARADDKELVKVALLDMSSIVPAGMMSYGMMSPGMMNPGMMMGPGMMGQGQGMMNPNMMSPGMMGSGMMMGMMAVRIDKPAIKAGPVAFDVTNWSRSVVHEVLVISVDNPAAPLPYDYTQARVPEEQVKVLGSAEDLQPNASQTFEVTLAPGSYLLICNVPGHYAAGMVASFAVTP